MQYQPTQRQAEQRCSSAVVQRAAAGAKGAAAAPPGYGIDFLDRRNHTGLPDSLKAGAESLSGLAMDDVRVHYASPKPAQLGALAYTQGSEIHLAPGQEQHLPHEAWHVVQQKQGRVQPTLPGKGLAVNTDQALENEADWMGAHAAGLGAAGKRSSGQSDVVAFMPVGTPVVQAVKEKKGEGGIKIRYADSEAEAQRLLTRLTQTRFGYGFAELPSLLQALCLEYAQDFKKGGLEAAENLIFAEIRDIQREEKIQQRKKETEDDLETLEGMFEGNELALACVRVSNAAYAGGENCNPTVAGQYSQKNVNEAVNLWETVDDSLVTVASNFHGYRREDKAAKGKGNVGNTLDTRKVQANFICRWNGVTVNVHVNIVA